MADFPKERNTNPNRGAFRKKYAAKMADFQRKQRKKDVTKMVDFHTTKERQNQNGGLSHNERETQPKMVDLTTKREDSANNGGLDKRSQICIWGVH